MNINSWMVAWDTGGPVKVGPWPDQKGWSNGYEMVSGCCNVDRQSENNWVGIAFMFIDFNSLVVGYDIDPAELHLEFLKIDEYRRRIPLDCPGAES